MAVSVAQREPATRAESGHVRATGVARRLGETLIEAGLLDAATIEGALARQRELDAPLGRILVAQGSISSEDLLAALAAQANLPLVDLKENPPDPALLEGLDPHRCLALEALPWRRLGETLILAIGDPRRLEAARAAFAAGVPRVALVLARPEAVRDAVALRFRLRLREDARLRCPEPFSCRAVVAPGSRLFGLACLGGLGLAVVAAPVLTLTLVMAWVVGMNALTMGLRLFAIAARLRRGRARLRGNVPQLAEFQRLPTVSLLVPLKGEAKVVAGLIEALAAIDYPPELLDIKLILEEEDLPTRLAIDAPALPPAFEVIVVPKDARLQTKPRAMNYALPFCRGSIVGVYDAEDRPDPAQLRAVVAAFQAAPAEVGCVQGYLDFYNAEQNWLARCFTIEYAMWFRVLLHGIQRLGIPIPLGGTTVFFRRHALEAVGGWDAHNVTEDADLGMRLARFGYRTEMIRSVTLEEANCRAWRWIGQRARWLKGYAITWLTHMRAPVRLWRDLGWRGFLGFQVLFLGGLTSYLSMPLFWALWAAVAGLDLAVWEGLPQPLLVAFIASMLGGQLLMLVIALVALLDARRPRMLPWLLVLPLYWPLGAVAAYRAVGEAFTRPFHWTKTEHGLAPAPRPRAQRSGARGGMLSLSRVS